MKVKQKLYLLKQILTDSSRSLKKEHKNKKISSYREITHYYY